jgi:hypothetical protein
MNRLTALSIAILFATMTFVATVFSDNIQAADSATVTATVTAQNVSVAVTDGTITYGTLATGTTQDTSASGVDNSQTATNSGNVAIDINIRGNDSGDWTLGSSAGTDIYTHKFCTTTCDSSPTWTGLTTNYQTLSSSVSASGTQEFDMQIGTPSSTTNFSEQSVDVTVQAVAS